jgi:hypothetical protein
MSTSADKSSDDASLGDEQRVVPSAMDGAGEHRSRDVDDDLDVDLDVGLGVGPGVDDAFADTGDMFSAELENVSASDWDIDTTELWGGDGGYGGAEAGGESGFDFPL